MPEVRDWQAMRDWSARLLEQRTGAGVDEWNRRIAAASAGGALPDAPSLRAWLTEHGVTGYAQNLLVMERFGYPDFLTATADELIQGQYADRPHLRPILDRILTIAPTLGAVTIQARKGYVSLSTARRKFATVTATTRSRVDLALRLDGASPSGRLEESKRRDDDPLPFRIALHTPDDVDDEVLQWLHRAYAENA